MSQSSKEKKLDKHIIDLVVNNHHHDTPVIDLKLGQVRSYYQLVMLVVLRSSPQSAEYSTMI